MRQINKSKKLKILAVDDREENIYLLESMLKGSGYEVVTARNGLEALEKLKKEPVDMIVSDILMPKMDGFQLCRECKKDEALRKIPFVFYTATYTEKKDEEFALDLGAEKFIRKPVEPEAFLNILEGIIKEYKKRTLIAPKKPIQEDEVYLAEYNKRLVKKLEDEMRHLNEANKRLKESEERYRYLFEHSQTINILIGTDGKIIDINKSAAESLGYDKSELIGKDALDFIAPEHLKKAAEYLSKDFQDKYTPPSEFDIITKKGARKFLFSEGHAPLFEKGKQTGILLNAADITELKKVEGALRESEAKYRGLVSNIPGIVFQFVLRRDGSRSPPFVSEGVKSIIGLMPEEIEKDPDKIFNMILPRDDHNAVDRSIAESAETMKTWKKEFRVKTKTGEIKWLSASSTPHLLPDGNILWSGVVLDITSRKRVEEALQESEYVLKEAQRITHIGSWDVDVVTGKENLSDEMYKIYGIDHDFDTVFENIMTKLIHPDDREKVQKAAEDAIKGNPKPLEYRIVRPDGETRTVWTEGAEIIHDENGEVIKLIGTTQDITGRKQAEEALRDSEAKFRNLAEQSPNMIFINRKGRVVYANKKCEEVMGYKREEFYSPDFDFFTLIAPEYVRLVKENFSRHMMRGENPPLEYALITKEGRRIEAILATKLIRYERESAIIGIVTDITERKLAEEELRRAVEELARSNAEMETFVYSVAHDLRAPLRAMQGFGEALLEDYTDQMDPTARDYAHRIVAASHRMDTLIHDLLSYSRISRAEMELKPVGLEDIVADVIDHMGGEIQEKEAHVAVKKPLPEVVGNKNILLHVIGNIISNAVKFTAPGVKPQVRVWAGERDGRVRLWVEDNGIGIAPEYHERIFRVFERLHSIDEYPGTGIGLAIVHKGVERMGGEVGVESAPGKGSKFWIELPKVKK
ncbi:MAG: hypothetical protein A7316_05455 [Candidatus Altiarchaeales archaeon WOR_SM1_86-2]|nr:MAG: hypothetical protein A7316_05455 [Candidatus Altiarchaeales archaeon WOR_SM1_86-2]